MSPASAHTSSRQSQEYAIFPQRFSATSEFFRLKGNLSSFNESNA